MVHPVFISYSHTDGTYFAKEIVDKLHRTGVDAWIDDRTEEGKSWRPETEQALSHCQIMILVVTAGACMSIEVSKEYQLAKDEGKTIIPFLYSIAICRCEHSR